MSRTQKDNGFLESFSTYLFNTQNDAAEETCSVLKSVHTFLPSVMGVLLQSVLVKNKIGRMSVLIARHLFENSLDEQNDCSLAFA